MINRIEVVAKTWPKNAQKLRKIIKKYKKVGQIVIISSAFHMARVRCIFDQVFSGNAKKYVSAGNGLAKSAQKDRNALEKKYLREFKGAQQ